MFWTDRNFGGDPPHLVGIRNTETNGITYGRSSSPDMMRYFTTEPTCGTYGPISVVVSKGYEYEYTISNAGRQWKSVVAVDCSSDDCIAIQLR